MVAGGEAGTVDSGRCGGRYRRRWPVGRPVSATMAGGFFPFGPCLLSVIKIVLHLFILRLTTPTFFYFEYDCSMTYRNLILIIAGCSLDLAPDNIM